MVEAQFIHSFRQETARNGLGEADHFVQKDYRDPLRLAVTPHAFSFHRVLDFLMV